MNVDERLVKDVTTACRAVADRVGELQPIPRSE